MSRTVKMDPPRWSSKEKKSFRKPHYKSYRVKAKQLIRIGNEPPQYCRTSGWLTH